MSCSQAGWAGAEQIHSGTEILPKGEEVQRSSPSAALTNEQLGAAGAVAVPGGAGPAAMCFNKWDHTSCPCKSNICMCQTLCRHLL